MHISVDDLGILKWYVDGSHDVHWDCKGHAGAMFTLGQGAVTSYSRKVKLNTRSLTKTELVGADMYMPEMLWMLYFIQSQGYDLETVQLYQDNKSTELLMKNEQFSSRKETKHIMATFFFIKDRIGSRDIREVHSPTEEMWVEVLIKPLKSKAFRVMQSKLMNFSEVSKDSETNYENRAQAKDAEKQCNTSPVPGRMRPRHCRSVLEDCNSWRQTKAILE
jgi:hypothetical protein